MVALEDYGLIPTVRFPLDPVTQYSIYVGRKNIEERLELIKKRAFPIKSRIGYPMLGTLGAGKTHTLYFFKDMIEKEGFSIDFRYVKCPPLPRGSRLTRLYREMTGSLGQDLIFSLMEQIVEKALTEKMAQWRQAPSDYERIRLLNEYIDDIEFATITFKYRTAGVEMKNTIWRWFAGAKLGAAEVRDLGVITDNTDADRATKTLLSILRLHQLLNPEKFFFVALDEAEQLRGVGEASEYVEFFRRLLEVRGLILVIAATTTALEEIPILYSGAVRDRYYKDPHVTTPEGVLEIPEFTPQQGKRFIKELLASDSVRLSGFDVEKAVGDAQKKTKEKVTKDYYPFTEKTIDTALAIIQKSARPFTPRSIQDILASALGSALASNKLPPITSDVLS